MTGTFNLETLLRTDMSHPIPPSIVEEVLANPPFVQVPGANNIRDLGLVPNSPITPGCIYRSAAIHTASPCSLSALSIKMILDLCTEREVTLNPTPPISGVRNVWIAGTQPPSPINMSDFVEDGGRKAWVAAYMEILGTYAPAFRAALQYLLTSPYPSPMLFHCTAGKDRTGVLAALLLSLAGADKQVVAYDYALTRVGIEPSREMLLQMLKLWNTEWSDETLGMQEFIQVKGEYIIGFLEGVKERYGCAEEYVKGVLGFSGEDAEKIKMVY
jgi:hypothetical protein